MKTYDVFSHYPGKGPYQISGEDIVSAITTNFARIASDANLGGASGYRLTEPPTLNPPEPNTTRGNNHFARLFITASGLPLANGHTSPTKMTEVDIVCAIGEFTESITLPLKAEQ